MSQLNLHLQESRADQDQMIQFSELQQNLLGQRVSGDCVQFSNLLLKLQ